MAYTYTLTYQTRSLLIEPTSEVKLVVKQEEGEVFFRHKLSGSLSVGCEGFKFLLEAEHYADGCCQEVLLTIGEKCAHQAPTVLWTGYFTLQNIEWDLDQQTCEISGINPRDGYDCVLRNWQKQINLLYFLEKPPFPFEGQTYSRGMDLIDSIRYLMRMTLRFTPCEDAADMSRSELSGFLTDTTNPVTQESPNPLNEILIMQLSDAKLPDARNPAVGSGNDPAVDFPASVNLKEMLTMLKDFFNAYWFINADGRIQIEHISYFPHRSYTPPAVTLDLTAPTYVDQVRGKRGYKHQVELLKGMQGLEIVLNQTAYDNKPDETVQYLPSAEFGAAYMIYAGACVPTDEKGERTHEIVSNGSFMTDFLSCVYRPDVLPDEGWVLIQVRFEAELNSVVVATLPVGTGVVANGNLSATALYKSYKRYNASFGYGHFTYTKDNLTRGWPIRNKTTVPIQSFTELNLPLCCGQVYDLSGLVVHPLHSGARTQQVQYNLLEGTLSLVLVAPSQCNNEALPDLPEGLEPTEGCAPVGTPLRTETSTDYCPDGSVRRTNITLVYADGNCGEYSFYMPGFELFCTGS